MRRPLAAAFVHIPGVLTVVLAAFHVSRAGAADVAGAAVVGADASSEFQAEFPAPGQQRISSANEGAPVASAAAADVARRPLMRAADAPPLALAQVAEASAASRGSMTRAIEAELVSMLQKQQAEIDELNEKVRERKEVDAWKTERTLSRTRRHVPIAEQLAHDFKASVDSAGLQAVVPPAEKQVQQKAAPQVEQLTEEEKAVAAPDFNEEELQVLRENGVVADPKKALLAEQVASNQHKTQNVKAWVESHSQHRAVTLPSGVHRHKAGGLLDDKIRRKKEDPNAAPATDNAVADAEAAVAEGVAQGSGAASTDSKAEDKNADEKALPVVSYKVNVVTKICIGFGLFAAILLAATGALVYAHSKKEAAMLAEGEEQGSVAERYEKMKADMQQLKQQHEKLKQDTAEAQAAAQEAANDSNLVSKVVYGDSALLHERDSPEQRLRRHYAEMCGLAIVLVCFCGIVVMLVSSIAAPNSVAPEAAATPVH